MGTAMARPWVDRHWRLLLSVVGIGLLLTVALATPGGRAAATGFLAQFRVQQFAVITIDPQDPAAAFASLDQLGTIQHPGSTTGGPDDRPSLRPADSVEAAAERTGIAVKTPTQLPAGVVATPRVLTSPSGVVSFTLDRAKATAYLAEQGESGLLVPEALDGATLRVQIPAAVVLMYGDAAGQPSLLVAQAPSPTVDVSGGASLADFRAFLLSIPGLPTDTVAQLRAIEDWTRTLPIPIPQDEASSREVTVGGAVGVSIRDAQTRYGFVVWQRDGLLYAVAGEYGEQDLLAVAASLG